ncbi:uncharacterized protein LOC111087295 [Limulus polyphemus]|uniref:Uncharacterized protein LOC111087295 n=1 Tax=Limulus polyphemus TaxID=6850 RepID=A0ABM1SZX7_LIMPO|nr:uncharacterized protein LOC111087295 [Limulus polyphemus]
MHYSPVVVMPTIVVAMTTKFRSTHLIPYSAREGEAKKGITEVLERKRSNGSLTSSSSKGSHQDEEELRAQQQTKIKKRPAPLPPSERKNCTIGLCDSTGWEERVNNSHSCLPVSHSRGSSGLEERVNNSHSCLPVSHSRGSSDSSGYHEASVFSELQENSYLSTTIEETDFSTPTKSLTSSSSKGSHQDEEELRAQQQTKIKKRPAPPPPSERKNCTIGLCDNTGWEERVNNSHSSLPVSHSRGSSDSSGYQASVFSELEENGYLSTTIEETDFSTPTKVSKNHNFNLTITSSTSNILAGSASEKKRKAPPPPPAGSKKSTSKTQVEPVRTSKAHLEATNESRARIGNNSDARFERQSEKPDEFRDIDPDWQLANGFATTKEYNSDITDQEEVRDHIRSSELEVVSTSDMATFLPHIDQKITNQQPLTHMATAFPVVEQDIILNASVWRDTFPGSPSSFGRDKYSDEDFHHLVEEKSSLSDAVVEPTRLLSVESELNDRGQCVQKTAPSTGENCQKSIPVNFKIGSYKKEKEDIYTINTEEGPVEELENQVRLKCTNPSELESSPLTSMLNLVSHLAVNRKDELSQKSMYYSDSEHLRKVQLTHDIKSKALNLKLSDQSHQFHAKYGLVKEELVLRKEQFAQNQSFMKNGENNTVICVPFVDQNSLRTKNSKNNVSKSLNVKYQDISKQKHQQDVSMVKTRQSSTTEGHQRSKSQVSANVTISSWQQRSQQDDSSKYKSHGMENLVQQYSKWELSATEINHAATSNTSATNVSNCSTKYSEEKPQIEFQINSPIYPSSTASKSFQTGKWKQNITGNQNNVLGYRESEREPKLTRVNITTDKSSVAHSYVRAPILKSFSENTVQNLLNESQKKIIDREQKEEFIKPNTEAEFNNIFIKHSHEEEESKNTRTALSSVKIKLLTNSEKEFNGLINGYHNTSKTPPTPSIQSSSTSEQYLTCKNKCKEEERI